MARPLAEDTEEKPLDPAVERVRKKLVRFVAINLGLLFLAVMAVVGALVYKTRTPAPANTVQSEVQVPAPSGAGPTRAELVLPQGSRMLSYALSGNRISIEAELAGGERAIFVFDAADGRMVGQYLIRIP